MLKTMAFTWEEIKLFHNSSLTGNSFFEAGKTFFFGQAKSPRLPY